MYKSTLFKSPSHFVVKKPFWEFLYMYIYLASFDFYILLTKSTL